MRYPALQGKRDANEPEVISALEAAGATVDQNPIGSGKPDLDVGYQGVNYKMEIKTPHGKLNVKQRKWFRRWAGQATVVRSPADALAVIGVGVDLAERARRAGM